ncbi:hypothetical protein F383_29870 [Gossypium arboreum]|uniref:Uncharacterized protein n=1 Tax=Gossypium arboreum TaxID=29729 RepID=A0A0B0PGX2_GOSAR|nr:hypothetical protein F383_29870 [Gossypium arboreum]
MSPNVSLKSITQFMHKIMHLKYNFNKTY